MYMSDNKSNLSALMGIKHDHAVAFTFTIRFGFGLSLYSTAMQKHAHFVLALA